MSDFNFINLLYKYLLGCLALLGVFLFIGFFEIYFLSTKQVDTAIIELISFKIVNEIFAVAIIGILFLPLYLLFNFLIKKYGIYVFVGIAILLLIIQISLVKYYLTTLLNLGSDLLGYSYNDIVLTVSSSASFSFISLLPFIVVPLLFIFVLKFTNSIKKKKIVVYSALTISILVILIKVSVARANDSIFQNKIYFLASDILKSKIEKNKLAHSSFVASKEFPLLRNSNEIEDVLGPFFTINDKKPNIVLIIVEGLGGEFVGDFGNAGFTPFLDSLLTKSLYWKNFVSTSGRTFGVIPSMIGSLPYGSDGFLEIKDTPNHLSLISILKDNGYTTNYYTGSNSSFDRIINYLEFNGIENVIDESKFGNSYKKTNETADGFSWGYPDSELFKKGLIESKETLEPRLDIYLTVSNHEPFLYPNKEKYIARVDKILSSNEKINASKQRVQNHKEIYASLLYTDESIKNYINSYKKRSDFENTIFIITGDHRLIPIPQKDELCRYHVPFIVYSPLLTKTKKIKAISSHLDVAPSLISFLQNNYNFNELDSVSWLGTGLDVSDSFRNKNKIPLMRYKGVINDFIYKDYMYSDGKLFKINENFDTEKVSDSKMLQIIKDSLSHFKELNAYLIQKNKILPKSKGLNQKIKLVFSKEQLASIKKLVGDVDSDSSYQIARSLAFEKDFKNAHLICDYILNELPNHADAIILKGRIYAWDGNYLEAEKAFLNAQKRAPFYDDVYLAILDTYWWAETDEKSAKIYFKALGNNIKNPELGFKWAKALVRLNKQKLALKVMDSLVQKHPSNKIYKEFKNTLN